MKKSCPAKSCLKVYAKKINRDMDVKEGKGCKDGRDD